jgi:aromatic ring-cleaving dioxygenase
MISGNSGPSVANKQTMATPEPRIAGYHAHVYFNADTVAQARALCFDAAQRFPLKMGRVHEKPVGPHPDWSCQLAFRASLFGEVIPWLAMHRAGLVVFVHPVTGNDLIDHRDRAIWMGAVRPLDLSVLSAENTPTTSYEF